jgi:hypothetical protein
MSDLKRLPHVLDQEVKDRPAVKQFFEIAGKDRFARDQFKAPSLRSLSNMPADADAPESSTRSPYIATNNAESGR